MSKNKFPKKIFTQKIFCKNKNFPPKNVFAKQIFSNSEISDIGKEDLKRRLNIGPWKGEKENFHLFIFRGVRKGGKPHF